MRVLLAQAFLKLRSLRDAYPGVPVMLLTATATPKVRADVVRTLGLQGDGRVRLVTQSFDRPNLR